MLQPSLSTFVVDRTGICAACAAGARCVLHGEVVSSRLWTPVCARVGIGPSRVRQSLPVQKYRI